MGKADRISGFPWLILAVFVIIESYRMGLGTAHEPGPGFLYFGAGILLGILSLVILIRAWKSEVKEEPQVPLFAGENVLKVVLVTASVFLYAFGMEGLGFIPVTLLLFIFLLGFVEKKGWLFTGFVSVLVTAIAYLIFESWLQSQLPKGFLEFLRF
jgi:putative tricarboxylic transport membrane protein